MFHKRIAISSNWLEPPAAPQRGLRQRTLLTSPHLVKKESELQKGHSAGVLDAGGLMVFHHSIKISDTPTVKKANPIDK